LTAWTKESWPFEQWEGARGWFDRHVDWTVGTRAWVVSNCRPLRPEPLNPGPFTPRTSFLLVCAGRSWASVCGQFDRRFGLDVQAAVGRCEGLVRQTFCLGTWIRGTWVLASVHPLRPTMDPHSPPALPSCSLVVRGLTFMWAKLPQRRPVGWGSRLGVGVTVLAEWVELTDRSRHLPLLSLPQGVHTRQFEGVAAPPGTARDGHMITV
jgi:hypothetical protein